MPRFAARCAVALIVAVIAGAPIRAQSTVRLGKEFQVNTYTTSRQSIPAVGVDGDGDFVVTWSSRDQDGSNDGIFGRRFSASGSPQAAEFQINSYTGNYQAYPFVAVNGAGDFIVSWSSFFQDGDSYGVFARRFSASGSPQGAEFMVNSYTTVDQRYGVVAIDGEGDFVVAWQSSGQDGSMSGIFARRFDAAGVAQAAEFMVNTYTLDGQYQPSVAVDGDGDFAIAWQDSERDGYGNGVFARRFTSAGVAEAAEFQVNTYTAGDESSPTVVMRSGGEFVVTWESDEQDGSGQGIFARRFDSAGVAQAVELQVNTYTAADQRFAAAAMDGDGRFIIAWHSLDQDGSDYGVFARHFDAAGTAEAAEIQVNTRTANRQSDAAVAMAPGGDFVVAWRSRDQDGDDDGVFAQRFATLAVLDIDGDGETAPLTDGLLVLRFLFGFTGNTLINGAVDQANCSRCDAGTIAAYLETLI